MIRFCAAIVFGIVYSCGATSTDETNVSDIKKYILEDRDFLIKDETFGETLDFTGMKTSQLIGKDQLLIDIKAAVTFRNCVFNEPVILYQELDSAFLRLRFAKNLTFIDCIFKKGIIAKGIEVQGRVDFSGSTFEEDADFRQSYFNGVASFKSSVFQGNAQYQYAEFEREASFIRAEFEKISHFQGVTFKSPASFQIAKFFGPVDFSLSKFRDDVEFNYGVFHSRAIFDELRCFGEMNFVKSEIKEAFSMQKCILLENPDFRGVISQEYVDQTQCEFLK